MRFTDELVSEMTTAGSVPPVTSAAPVVMASPTTKPKWRKRSYRNRSALSKAYEQHPEKKTEALEIVDALTEDANPVVPGLVPGAKVMAKKRHLLRPEDEDEDEKVEESIVDFLTEDDSVIPADAVELDVSISLKGSEGSPEVDKIKEPEEPVFAGDTLMDPTVALIAPDVTPNADVPVDPSKTQRNDPALATILGKDAPQHPHVMPRPQPAASAEAMPNESMLQAFGIDIPSKVSLDESRSGGAITEVIASAENAGIPMPEHKAGDGTKILSAFRRFGPPQM